jgi:hypothetical protein
MPQLGDVHVSIGLAKLQGKWLGMASSWRQSRSVASYTEWSCPGLQGWKMMEQNKME